MSSRDWFFRIKDILHAIDPIQKNELVIDAVIRNLEVIGEASKSIPANIRRLYPDIPWAQMSGMRNILIHEYFRADIKTVWQTIKKYLPKLQKQLLQIPLDKK